VGDARVRWLLGLALVLAALRFVVVPWTQSQVEQRQQLEVLTKRLDRSASVVANADAIRAAQGKVSAATAIVRKRFPQVADKDGFRLDAQRTLAGIASRGGAKVVLFDWVVDGDAPQAGLAYGRVNARIEGPFDSLVSVHGQIEAEMPFAAVREVTLDFTQDGVSGLSSGTTTVALVMDLYYQQAAAVPTPTAAPPSAAADASAAARSGT
jgi:hypothetical protein